ncbi:MAG: 3-oxoadipate enol-lactonase [Burkholderiales bacterium]
MKAKVNGIETHYEVHGSEGAPWLTFSHSLACSVRMWDGQVAEFKDRWHILVYDTRGHGASEAPKGPYSLDMLAEDLSQLLQHLGIKRTHYVGLSMGGMIGQTLVLKDPAIFDRVVLADTGHAQTPETLKQWEERVKTAESRGMEPLVQGTIERWFTKDFRDKPVVKTIADLIRSTPVPGYVGCCQAIAKLSTTARLKEIKRPVLAIAGEQDAAAPGTRFIGENVPGAKLVLIPQAAHIANIEQAEAFNRALREFLSSPASARA